MFRSIRWRIILPYIGLIFVTMLSLGIYLSSFMRQNYLKDLQFKLATEAHMIGNVITPDLESVGNSPNLDSQARYWAAIVDARVTIIAPDGNVWGESQEDRALMTNHSDRPEVIQALKNGEGSSTRFSQTLGLSMMYTAVTVTNNNKILALVRVALPLQAVSVNVANLQRVLVAVTLLVTGLALMFAILIAGRITRPIRELTQSAWRMDPIRPSDPPIPSSWLRCSMVCQFV
jgi:two-component system phosphate regulon sensor histidine kinase PhoR